MARDAIAEMGQRVRKECAPEEVRYIVVPAHGCSLLIAEPMVAGLSIQKTRVAHALISIWVIHGQDTTLENNWGSDKRQWSGWPTLCGLGKGWALPLSLMPKNLGRVTGRGDLHFITFCCYQRCALLGTVQARNLAVQTLGEVRARYGFVLVGCIRCKGHRKISSRARRSN